MEVIYRKEAEENFRSAVEFWSSLEFSSRAMTAHARPKEVQLVQLCKCNVFQSESLCVGTQWIQIHPDTPEFSCFDE